MSRLLINEPPLQVLPSLAKKIGLNEAIVLQQIQYWIHGNMERQSERHFREGKWWTYNTIEEWQKQFVWWSESTIKRTLTSLRDAGLVEAKQLSKDPYDHTNWYTINYEALDKLTDEPVGSGQHEPDDQVNMNQSDKVNMHQSTYTETSTETSSRESGANGAPAPEQPYLDEQFQKPTEHPAVIAWRRYHKWSAGKHRWPQKGQMQEIIEVIGSETDSIEQWKQALHAWGMNGNSPVNVQGQLDWYREGVPEYAQQQNGDSSSRRKNESAEEREARKLAMVENVFGGEL